MAAKRELIEPLKGDNPQGEFKEIDDVGRSLSVDRRTRAKNVSRPGTG